MKKHIFLILFLASIVIASILMRLLPHPANFIPIGALALFSGTYIKSRWGILLPVAVMAFSDMIIGMHSLYLVTWGSFLLIGMIGWWVRSKKSMVRILSGTVMGSVLFYLLTNFAVWLFTPLYAKTAAGLVQCYYMAIPFFRNTAIGDLFYVGVFFGLYAVVRKTVELRQKQVVREVK